MTKKDASSWKNPEMVENGKGILQPNGKGSTASDIEVVMEDTTALTMSATIEKSLIMCQTIYISRMKGEIFLVQPEFLLHV